MGKGGIAVVWFLQDLRLGDNPALDHAVAEYDAVIPLYLWTPDEHGEWPPGGAAKWWLHHSLASLDGDLRQKGSRLVLRKGAAALPLLRAVARETGARAVFWNARYEPALRERDREVVRELRGDGLTVQVFRSRILHDPRRIQTSDGNPYRVFTPFWKKLQDAMDVGATLDRPRMGESKAPARWPASESLGALGLDPKHQWADGLAEAWTPGEAGAQRRLDTFIERALLDYDEGRNRPDRDGSSRLSPYLQHGELSPRQVWNAVAGWVSNRTMKDAADAYLREIAWREFGYHLLFHFPHTTTEPLNEKFERFPWDASERDMKAWCKGRTGYPVVDAGMRQLWRTGWMHNRTRMIVASFLTKDLLIPWQDGARWFWDTLVDADLANNTLGWQWTAGSGADAQPYFRIFNPVSQGNRYDPDGAYVRAWVPELAELPSASIHEPWKAKNSVLEDAGVVLGDTYPSRIVDHREARDRALEAYQGL